MKKLLNPFVYYSGGITLAVGLIGMAAMVAAAYATGQTFRSIISLGVGERSWLQLAGHLFVGWLLFSAILYGAARLFSPSRIRIIDIAGNQALAKLPGLPLLLATAAISDPLFDNPAQFEQLSIAEMMAHVLSVKIILASIAAMALLVWFFCWSWLGFSIAANLRGGKSVGIYIGCYLLAEVLAAFCLPLLR